MRKFTTSATRTLMLAAANGRSLSRNVADYCTQLRRRLIDPAPDRMRAARSIALVANEPTLLRKMGQRWRAPLAGPHRGARRINWIHPLSKQCWLKLRILSIILPCWKN
jgi:hypothetical protein